MRKARFVVGNLGEDHNTMFFVGEVASLRISAGERYRADFTPRRDLLGELEPIGVRASEILACVEQAEQAKSD